MTKTASPTLPRIVLFLGCSDAGEFGAASCPHCGADGRYVWTFTCDDGTTRGAMSGCLKRFPVSPLADEHRRIIERVREREAAGRTLASWDKKKLEAIEAAAAGTLPVVEAEGIVQAENFRRDAWLRSKKFKR